MNAHSHVAKAHISKRIRTRMQANHLQENGRDTCRARYEKKGTSVDICKKIEHVNTNWFGDDTCDSAIP